MGFGNFADCGKMKKKGGGYFEDKEGNKKVWYDLQMQGFLLKKKVK